MKILLIEDQQEKIESIRNCIKGLNLNKEYTIYESRSLDCARRSIIKYQYDLIIFDVYMPLFDDQEETSDISNDILHEFTQSKNYQSETIVITKYEIEAEKLTKYNELGVTVVQYSSVNWKDCLKQKLDRIVNLVKYDFLIFCALVKERSAYSRTDATLSDRKIIKGLNCLEIAIGCYNGLCIIPTKMGLVNMAITATKAIEAFQPKIVAMSGICAGSEGSNFLDVIIANMSWEYQTGKFKDNEFVQEPYQRSLNHQLNIELGQFLEAEELGSEIKDGLSDDELEHSEIYLGPISSGSAVISSEKKMVEIMEQHRKMSGVEMEMYSVYEAAFQSLCQPLFFGVKSVVDKGDSKKGDSYHTTACILSARFVIKFLTSKLPSL